MVKRYAWALLPGVVVAGIVVAHLSAAGVARLTVRQDQGPPAIVLKGATVVVGNGQVLQHATVVLRGQLIEAVGAQVTVPAGTTEVDLKGAFLYPGFIDALSDRFQKPAPGAKEPEPTDTDSAAMFADVRAADRLDPASKDLASWREAGVLAANVSPAKGLFMGQTAVVTLGDPSDRLIVNPSVAMRMALQGLGYRNRRRGQSEPGGVYPTRLIGVLAYTRQTLLDAHHYDDALRLGPANPGTVEPPASNRAMQALLPVARRTMSLMVPASWQREVLRVVDIADETNVSCIVVGGYEAADLAADLNKRRIPVVVTLDYPGPDVDVHPEFRVPVEVLRYREHAPKAAGELVKAGVRTAFASVGLRSGTEFLGNLRLAVRQGLPKDAAVRAAALTAAEILGVDRQLGSLEPGKIANLIVTDGDLFEAGTRIRAVYVAGKRHEVTAGAAAPAPMSASVAPPPAPEPKIPPTPSEVLIRNATVMTAATGTIKGGSVLIRDGKIAAVGQKLAAGPRVLVIDGTGKWVTPGLIDCHVHSPTDSHNEATMNVTAQTNLKDTLYPSQAVLYWVLAAGVTTTNVFHGSVNPIGGQTAVIKSRWGKDAHGLLFEGARLGLKMSVEEFVQRAGTPSSYMGEEAVLREAFEQAREYQRRWEAYEKQRGGGTPPPFLAPRRDLAMEALVEVLKGERWVHAHILNPGKDDDPRGMLLLLRLADEFGFRVATFQHAATAYRVADELARHGTGASIFSFFTAETEYNAFILTRRGVVTSLNSDGVQQGRDLNQQAGMLMRTGLTEDEALALITINPAKQLGIEKRVGSVEVGKDADLVIWNHYPLGFDAIAEQVFIDGQLYFSRDHDRKRQAWLEAERVRLQGASASRERPVPAAEVSGLKPRGSGDATDNSRPQARGSGPLVDAGRGAPPKPAPAGTYVIQHAKVFTVSGPTIEDGSVVIKDGKIADVGPAVAIPPDAKLIDGRGLSVYPGLFDPDSNLGMVDSNPETLFGPMAPHLTASTSFIPADERIPIARAAGLTHIVIRPARGAIPGQGELMNLAGWTGEEMLAKPRAALFVAFPTVGELQYSEDERYAVTPWSMAKPQYDRQVRQLQDFFALARKYRAAKERHDADWTPNARLEAMIPVLERRQVVIVEAANAVDIRSAVQFARDENVNYVLAAHASAWRVADFLKENNVRVLLGSTVEYPRDMDDPYDSVYAEAAVLEAAGVPFAFSTLGNRLNMPRLFVQSAANAITHGLSRDTALRAVTLTAAEFLGVADLVGSVDKGKVANLVVTAGDLFDAQASVRYVFINGEPASLRTIETDLYEKYSSRPAPSIKAVNRGGDE